MLCQVLHFFLSVSVQDILWLSDWAASVRAMCLIVSGRITYEDRDQRRVDLFCHTTVVSLLLGPT